MNRARSRTKGLEHPAQLQAEARVLTIAGPGPVVRFMTWTLGAAVVAFIAVVAKMRG